MHQGGNRVDLLHHLSYRPTLFGERARRTGMHALAATGAGGRLSPFLIHLAHHPSMNAARGNIPDMRSFQFGTNPDAPRAKNAAIMIEHEARVRHVDA